jgi:hypothetical protein
MTWTPENFPQLNTPEWRAMNRRRQALIERKLCDQLTPAEAAELEVLQRETSRVLYEHFPPPPPASLQRLLARLEPTAAEGDAAHVQPDA